MKWPFHRRTKETLRVEVLCPFEAGPGDTVLARLPVEAKPEHFKAIFAGLSEQLPGVRVVVAAQGIDLAGLRREAITRRVPREATGLNGALFVHVTRDDDFRVTGIRFSYKWKDDSALDQVLSELGEAASEVVRDLAAAGRCRAETKP
jgi:hypothetical protein